MLRGTHRRKFPSLGMIIKFTLNFKAIMQSTNSNMLIYNNSNMNLSSLERLQNMDRKQGNQFLTKCQYIHRNKKARLNGWKSVKVQCCTSNSQWDQRQSPNRKRTSSKQPFVSQLATTRNMFQYIDASRMMIESSKHLDSSLPLHILPCSAGDEQSRETRTEGNQNRKHPREILSSSEAEALFRDLSAKESAVDVNAESIDFLLGIMREHSSEEGIQKYGCAFIRNMASTDSQVKSLIVSQGGTDVVIHAMRIHASNTSVQEQGLAALKNLAANSISNKIRIAAEGGIDSALDSMKQYPCHEGIQENGCALLWNLALHGENRQQIAAAGGISSVLHAMQQHLFHADIQENGCGAIRSLALRNPGNQAAIAEEGGIVAVLSAMKRQPFHAGVQESGCAALAILSYNNSENQIQIAALEGIPTAVRAMELYPAHAGVQENGCGAIWNLAADNTKNKRVVVDENGIAAILRAMKTHRSNAGVQLQASGALRECGFFLQTNPHSE